MNFPFWGAISGFLGVAFGAFGAHALKGRIEPELLAAFQTGVLYHLVHAVALLAMGSRFSNVPGWAFLAGTIFFSGSLYALAVTGVRAFGMITPFGGALFLVGWAAAAFAAFRASRG